MKKLMYFIPLILLLIFPLTVQAESYYIERKSSLTEQQREEYLNIVLNNEKFIEDSKNYNYYLIVYHESSNKPFTMSYSNIIAVMFFNNIPDISYNVSEVFYPLRYKYSNADKKYFIYPNNSGINTTDLMYLNFITYKDQIDTDKYYYYQVDYVLASNFSLSLGFDLTLLNEDLQELGVIKAADNIFETSFIEIEKDYTLDDILNSEDIIYSLSKQLIGPLPIEFEFIYSVVALGLAILIILVVLSPFIIIFKVWR